MSDELRIYIVVRKDAGAHMSKAKFGVQVAHATLTTWASCMRRDPTRALAYMGIDTDVRSGQAKIVLQVKNEKELRKLYGEARARKFDTALITDAGRTEFDGPTTTAVAIGPIWYEAEAKVFLKRVQLYEEPRATPVAYRFDGNDRVRVEWRGSYGPGFPDDSWAISERGSALNRDGDWEVEPMPSNRTAEFIRRCRFPLHEALKLGEKWGMLNEKELYERQIAEYEAKHTAEVVREIAEHEAKLDGIVT